MWREDEDGPLWKRPIWLEGRKRMYRYTISTEHLEFYIHADRYWSLSYMNHLLVEMGIDWAWIKATFVEEPNSRDITLYSSNRVTIDRNKEK